MPPDLTLALAQIRAGQCSASDLVQRCTAAARSSANAHVFAQPLWDSAAATAAQARPDLPLAGLAVSVKDLFDMQGLPTRASAKVLENAPPALLDCPAVARLRAAGAAFIGRTHMSEFAFSGVGSNPHYGTPAAFDARFGPLPDAPRIAGGSSSGAAVSVATGAAFVGLGTDTGGSIRIPAALNGLVGFKSTARLVPLAGVLPLSPSLDSACAMTRSVRDARLVHEILAARRVMRSSAPLSAWRLAVPQTVMLDALEPAVAQVFARTLDVLRAAGARIDDIALPALADLASINATGGLAAAESYAWHRRLLAQQGGQYDPRVRQRIERGAHLSAADYLDIQQQRRQWQARMAQAMAGYDALLSPTVPMVAPCIADIAPADGQDSEADARRDGAFWQANALLLRNPSAVNMLDGCALSLPCHRRGELPVGLMLWQGPLRDDMVLHIGLQIEKTLSIL